MPSGCPQCLQTPQQWVLGFNTQVSFKELIKNRSEKFRSEQLSHMPETSFQGDNKDTSIIRTSVRSELSLDWPALFCLTGSNAYDLILTVSPQF